MRVFLVAALLVTASSCSKKSQDGLPPATDWQANSTGAMVQLGTPEPNVPPPPGMSNPKGGGNPHAGMDPTDPHAGLGIDPNDPNDPHGGMAGGGTDVTKLGLPPPDPNRPIDPGRYVKGVIKIHEKAKSRVKPGTGVFIIVKRADASGAPVGSPLAVDKLTWNKDELQFELTEKNAMVAGTDLTGDVIVTARYDQDGDALSKEPGDIVGQTRVKLPAQNVQIWLDTIL
jgi:hypothetical protein